MSGSERMTDYVLCYNDRCKKYRILDEKENTFVDHKVTNPFGSFSELLEFVSKEDANDWIARHTWRIVD